MYDVLQFRWSQEQEKASSGWILGGERITRHKDVQIVLELTRQGFPIETLVAFIGGSRSQGDKVRWDSRRPRGHQDESRLMRDRRIISRNGPGWTTRGTGAGECR